jgi:hypothetical protein
MNNDLKNACFNNAGQSPKLVTDDQQCKSVGLLLKDQCLATSDRSNNFDTLRLCDSSVNKDLTIP